MKPFCREAPYDIPVYSVRVLLFVIALMSFLPKSVSAQSSITYDLDTTIGECPGCDLYAHPNQFLLLSGLVPVAANTLKSYTSGSVDLHCGLVNTGSIVSDEYAEGTAYVFFGTMGLSLDAWASISPQYVTQGITPPCYQMTNPGKANATAYAHIGFSDTLFVTFPGVPAGTDVQVRFTSVWEGDLQTNDPYYAGAALNITVMPLCDPTGFSDDFDAPATIRIGYVSPVNMKTGSGCSMSIEALAVAHAWTGWDTYVSPPVWVPDGASILSAMNTFALYIDVLTPGASYYTGSGTIYPTSDSIHLDISRAGTGSGAVKSSPAGIDCGSTCSAHFLPGTTIELTAIPAADGSIFSGWSGNPTCIGGSVFMTTTKSCTATFDLCPGTTRASIGSTNYDSISLAYDGAATNGDKIKVLASNQQEGALDFNSGKSVALIGGYDCSFNNIVSYTVVTGSITISTSDVTIENIVIL